MTASANSQKAIANSMIARSGEDCCPRMGDRHNKVIKIATGVDKTRIFKILSPLPACS
ncbi:MAG: hypothetical protein RM338_12195 [Nostoc sp. DedQUE12a]|nr:hypothetical protein [Nostoc sp. DedQUE12a]